MFTDTDVFDAEIGTIFQQEWIAVTREEQLPNPGDYITYQFYADPIVLARSKSGVINAFSNVCLHRACPFAQDSPIAEGARNTKLFVGPNHKWTYELDGQLRGAPDKEQAADFDRSASLPQLHVEVWRGWVFINASKNPAPLAGSLKDIDERLAPFAPEALKTAGILHYKSPWNWKVLVENFIAPYHHMGPHADTLNGLYPHKSPYPAYPAYPAYQSESYLMLENPSIDESIASSFWVGLIYPNTMFALSRYPEKPILGWHQFDIHSIASFDLNIHALRPQSMIDDGSAKVVLDTYAVVHGEDIPVCDGVWQGVQSSYHQSERLSHLEGWVWDFHEYLSRKLSPNVA